MSQPPRLIRPLTRSMKLLGALFLTLSAATPASSVFVIVPDVLTQAGTGGLISMLLAAVIAICVAQVYAELGSAFPLSGGEYAIVGRILGPLTGFIVLGLNLVNSLLATAVLSLGVAEYLGAAIPHLAPIPTALGVIWAATLLGMLNIRTNALVTGLFVLVEIACLAALAALGFLHPARSPVDLVLHPQALNGGALGPTPMAAIGLAVTVAIFAYDGYGSAVYFGEELHEAPRRIGRAIIGALVIVMLAELIPLIAVLTGAPSLATLLQARSIFGDFVRERRGDQVAAAIGIGVGLAIVNAVIAMVLLTSRQLYSTGRDETWGRAVSGWFSGVHARFGSPWPATLVTGVLASALCFVPLKLLLIATGAGVAVIYSVLCIAALLGRASRRTDHAPFRMRGFPFAPIIALVALVGVIWSSWQDPMEGRTGLLIAVAVAVISAAWFVLALRRRGWVLRGPEDPPV